MTPELALSLIADGFILLGVVVTTIGVIGMVRMPDIFTKLHAASKAVFLGVCSFLVAVIDSGDPAIISRALLIALLLVLTTPVAAHEIARAAVREQASRSSEEVALTPGRHGVGAMPGARSTAVSEGCAEA